MFRMSSYAVGIAAGFSASLSWLFYFRVLGGVPHLSDELNYIWQARLFSDGKVSAPVHAVPDVFDFVFLMEREGRIASIFPPGWSWALAVSLWSGLYPVFPMLLGGLIVVLIYILAKIGLELFPQLHACDQFGAIPWVSVFLVVSSPAAIVMSGTYMPHSFALLLFLLFLIGLIRLVVKKSVAGGILAGTAAGLLAATRPIDALGGCGPYLLLAAGLSLHTTSGLRRVASTVLPLLVLVALLGWHNRSLTGSFLVFPQDLYFQNAPRWLFETPPPPDCNALGFGAERGCTPTWGSMGHTPTKALLNLRENWLAFDRNLWGGAGGMVLVVIGALTLRREFLLILPPFIAISIGYALYWFPGLAYGARFLHVLLGPTIFLGSVGIVATSRFVSSRLPQVSPALNIVVLLALLSGRSLSYIPALITEYRNGYFCVDNRVPELVESLQPGKSLILMGFSGTTLEQYPLSVFPGFTVACNSLARAGGGLAQNDPELKQEVIYGRLPKDPSRLATIRAAFPDRRVLIYVNAPEKTLEEILEYSALGITKIWPNVAPTSSP